MKWLAVFLLAMLVVYPVSAGSKCASCTGVTSGATIAVNWTFTGAPGTAALVTNIGTPSAAIFDFTIPQGLPGSGGSGSADMSWNTSYLLRNDGSLWILQNKSEILSATLTNVTNAQYAALRAADDHIATNASAGGVSAPAALQAADAHILTNQTLGAGANWTTLIQSDFFDPSTQAIPGFLGAAISSGTVGAVASDANHPGVIYMRDSTTAAGGYRYGCQGTQVLKGGEFFEVVFNPVGVRGTQASKFGWADTAAAATLPVDGVWFNISGTGSAQTFMGATSSNSNRAYTPSYTTTTATWYRGTISIASEGAPVTYTLYNPSGVQLWQQTISANIPNATGRDTSPCIIVAENSADAAANILQLDYVRWGTTKTLIR